MDRGQNLRFYPWLVGIIVALMILCWSVRALAIHLHRVAAAYFGAEVVVYYGWSWDVICFLGGNYRRGQWHCRPDWPYETYLAILTLSLMTSIVMWVVLRKKWQPSQRLPFDSKTNLGKPYSIKAKQNLEEQSTQEGNNGSGGVCGGTDVGGASTGGNGDKVQGGWISC